MSFTLPSPVEYAWDALRGAAVMLSALPGLAAGLMAPAVWREAMGDLRRAEATLRRLILCLADGADAPPPLKPRQPGEAPKTLAKGVRARGFRLLEPLQDPNWGEGDSLDVKPIGQPDAELKCAKGLARRLAALKAVMDHPVPAIRRMQRWQARRHPGRTIPIRLFNIPGYRRYTPGDGSMGTLDVIHRAAIAVLNKGPRARA